MWNRTNMSCLNRETCVDRQTKVQLNINVLIKKKKKSPGLIVEQYSKSSKEIFFFIVLVSIIPRRHQIKLSFDFGIQTD